MHQYNKGFSLVELSIVLVIIGLLTGGVIVGKNLIRGAELRSVTAEYGAIKSSVTAFRDKYNALPGDMTRATQYWGNADTGAIGGQCADKDNDVGTGVQTCNGNGDGVIGGGVAESHEWYRLWQHMAAAQMYPGKYDGVAGAAGYQHAIVGQNIATAKLKNAGWSIWTQSAANVNYFSALGHLLQIGGNVTNSWHWGAVLTNNEAWSIDTKMDDGKAGMGDVITTSNTFRPNCASTDVDRTALYQRDITGNQCVLMFKLKI